MELKIKGKKALVTGCGRGLGAEIVKELATEGVKVCMVSRPSKNLNDLYKSLGGSKYGHYKIESDLTNEIELLDCLKEIKNNFSTPDIIVNNLGDTLDIRDPYCSIADWRKIFRINLEVGIEINNFFIPDMIKNKWGRIVHITSIAALENQGPVPYCAVKAAVTSYVRSMGRILAKDNIIMTSVLPGAVITKGGYWDKLEKSNKIQFDTYKDQRMAIGRFGHPNEIASVVAFLCSQNSSFMVGSMVPVDGGQGRVFFQ